MARVLEDLVIRLAGDNADLRRKLSQSDADVRRFSSQAKREFGDLAGSVRQLGAAIGVAFAFEKLRQFSAQAIELGSSISDASKRIGIASDALQVLRIQAGDAGIATGAIDGAMQAFSKTLGQLQAGLGKAQKQLGELDPALLAQLRAARSVGDAYLLVASAVEKAAAAGDEQRAAALASATGLSQLLGVLKEGPKAFADVGESARRTGQILSGEAIGALDEFGDAMDRVKRVAAVGFAEGLGSVNAGVGTLSETLSDPQMLEGISSLSTSIGSLTSSFLGLAGAVSKAFNSLVEWKREQLREAGIDFGPAIGLGGSTSSGGLGATNAGFEQRASLAASLGFDPFGNPIGGRSGSGAPPRTAAPAGVRGRSGGGGGNAAPQLFLDEAAGRLLREPLDEFSKLNQMMMDDFGKQIRAVDLQVDGALRQTEARAQAFGDFFGSLTQNLLLGSAGSFKDMAKSFAASLLEMEVSAAASSLFKWFTKATGGAGQKGEGGGSILGSIFGAITPFADGGIVTRPRIGLVGEAGPEAIIPLDRVARSGAGSVNVTIVNEIPGASFTAQRRPTGEVEIVASLFRREVSRGGLRDELRLRHASGMRT